MKVNNTQEILSGGILATKTKLSLQNLIFDTFHIRENYPNHPMNHKLLITIIDNMYFSLKSKHKIKKVFIFLFKKIVKKRIKHICKK